MPGENYNIFEELEDYIGETVTIFTTSGGPSGSGFTGVLIAVNPDFVRLITQIGTAPGCALGNTCDMDRGCFGRRRGRYGYNNGYGNGYGGGYGYNNGYGYGFNPGSVTDIPVDRIASFVHNAV